MAIQIMEQKVWFPCANSIFPVSSNITAGKGHQSFLPYSLDGPFLSPLFFLFSLASPFLPFSLEATLRPRPPHLFDLFISPTVPFPPSLSQQRCASGLPHATLASEDKKSSIFPTWAKICQRVSMSSFQISKPARFYFFGEFDSKKSRKTLGKAI